jgi:hypothetical protein
LVVYANFHGNSAIRVHRFLGKVFWISGVFLAIPIQEFHLEARVPLRAIWGDRNHKQIGKVFHLPANFAGVDRRPSFMRRRRNRFALVCWRSDSARVRAVGDAVAVVIANFRRKAGTLFLLVPSESGNSNEKHCKGDGGFHHHLKRMVARAKRSI